MKEQPSNVDLEPETEWKKYSLSDLIEMAEYDGIICNTSEDIINYLSFSTECYFEQLDPKTFNVLFA